MKSITIAGTARETTGTKQAKLDRREGMVPCVLYGGEETVHFIADERELNKLIYTSDVYIVSIDIDGKQYECVMGQPQFHPVTDRLIHLDMIQIFEDKPVNIMLPVVLNGSPIGVRNGGVLRRNAKKLRVQAFRKDLPDSIELNIEKVKIGESIKVGELDFPGVTFLESDNRVVVAVKTSRKAIVDEVEDEEGEGEEGEEGAVAEGAEASAEGGSESGGEEKADS